MELNSLYAISPVDGRYRHKTEELSGYFSEFGLQRSRFLSFPGLTRRIWEH
jgi:adenylosuccinate lyase